MIKNFLISFKNSKNNKKIIRKLKIKVKNLNLKFKIVILAITIRILQKMM